MNERVIYLETSALLQVLLEQGSHVGINEILADLEHADRLLTSRLTRIECERALLRLAIERAATPEALSRVEQEMATLFDRVEVIEISAEIAELAGRIAPASPLRSLEAIHLATWQVARRLAPDLELVTADRRFAAAAGVVVVGG
ncbi:MAG: type II toxin-antitoxin system VapC family toxin [Thermoanaerobaculia bacterium]